MFLEAGTWRVKDTESPINLAAARPQSLWLDPATSPSQVRKPQAALSEAGHPGALGMGTGSVGTGLQGLLNPAWARGSREGPRVQEAGGWHLSDP